jgi:hypothetical protein
LTTFTLWFIWGMIFLLLFQPGIAHDGADFGLELFGEALLPYLLPYLILTQWLIRLPKKERNEGRAWLYTKTYAISAFGGFPTGAAAIAYLTKSGTLSRKDSSLLLAVCHSPSPMFLIGFVGTELLGKPFEGWKLLAIIHLLNLILLIFVYFKGGHVTNNSKKRAQETQLTSPSPLSDSLKESANIILLVATTVIFFATISTVLSTLIANFMGPASDYYALGIFSALEMTTALQIAKDLFEQASLFPYIIAAILSLNGLSIHLQVLVIAKTAKIPIRPYIYLRFLHVLVVPVIYALLQ